MKHIVIEGPNGAGKTSLIKSLSEMGYKTLSSPAGTDLAKYIRQACRGADQWKDLSDIVKFLLFSAARCDEFDKLIKDQDGVIVCDRWHLSTYVYQCILGNIPVDLYEKTIHKDEKISMVIILDADNKTLQSRVHTERSINETHGKCSWTQDVKTMNKIADIYRTKLPKYLKTKKIPYLLIDTTDIDQNKVLSLVVSAMINS